MSGHRRQKSYCLRCQVILDASPPFRDFVDGTRELGKEAKVSNKVGPDILKLLLGGFG